MPCFLYDRISFLELTEAGINAREVVQNKRQLLAIPQFTRGFQGKLSMILSLCYTFGEQKSEHQIPMQPGLCATVSDLARQVNGSHGHLFGQGRVMQGSKCRVNRRLRSERGYFHRNGAAFASKSLEFLIVFQSLIILPALFERTAIFNIQFRDLICLDLAAFGSLNRMTVMDCGYCIGVQARS